MECIKKIVYFLLQFKLSKKLLLVPGTEALDEAKPVVKNPSQTIKPSKKLLIVESDSD
jgi:hypothetical protein